jgi:ribose 5-phosphate isomerase A
MSLENLKKQAAEKAVEQVRNGMILGLGTGSTARYAIIKIGELWQSGVLTDIVAIPTGEATAALARQYDLPLTTLTEHPVIDLTIDGADEIAPNLDLIKGQGGALLREKIIELASKRFIVIADESKLVDKLGIRSPLPVEVIRFEVQYQADWLRTLGCQPVLRRGETEPYLTDNHNYIVDCTFPDGIDDPVDLAALLTDRVGVVAHGLFLGMANEAIVATAEGLRQI